jgi:hypothetical protein
VATLSRGCFVLLVGPDGSGKTTISDALTSRADALGIAVSRAHYRPGLIGGRREGSTATDTPRSQQQRSMSAGALKLALVATDMIVGYLFRWRSQRHSCLLIVERGWWDMAVDPTRYRLNPWLLRLVRLLGPLIPRADLVVLLVGAPAEIDSRKREIGVGEVTRQLASWEELASQAGRKTIRIDTVLHRGEDVADVILDAAFGDHSAPTDPVRRVPLTPSRLNLLCSGRCGPAARIYKPFHPIRRPMKQVGFAAARHGLTRREFAPFDVQELCRDLRLETDGYVMMQSSRAGRWVIGICYQGRLSTVVKVGSLGDQPLETEAATLSVLQNAGPGSIRVADIRWWGKWRERLILAVAALPPTRLDTTIDEAVELCNAMVNGAGRVPSVVHGDFAPWNVLSYRPEPVVVDWEASRFERVPLFDLSHFLITSGALLRNQTPQ